MWKLTISLKVKMFSWFLTKGKLQTRKRVSKYIKNIDTKCPLCKTIEENQDHLFLNYKYAKEICQISNDRYLNNVGPSDGILDL